MNVALAPEYEAMISDRIASGAYSSPADVICAGLNLLTEQDDELDPEELEALRYEIKLGLESSARGESTPFDVEKIKAEGRRRLAEMNR